MIGVFAIAGGEQANLARNTEGLLSTMRANPCWTADAWLGETVAAGRVGPTRPGAVWSSGDGLHRAWVDGFAYWFESSPPQTDTPAGAQDLAKAVITDGPDAALAFHGEFFAVVYDGTSRTLYAITDRFGTRTAYWHASGEQFAICSELGALVTLGLVPRGLNWPYVASILRLNKCRLSDATLFESARVVMPGTVQIYDLDRPGASPVQHRYYRHTFTNVPLTEGEWVEEISPLFRRAASAVSHRTKRLALSLSGGLDSRALLAAFPEDQRKAISAFSCGLRESADVQLASEVAARVGCQYENIDLGPSDFIECARLSVRRNEEFDIFVQGAQVALHKIAAQSAGGVMTGWDLDVPLRGTYLNDRVLGLSDTGQVRAAIEEYWGLFSREELHRIGTDEFVRSCADAPEDCVDGLLAHLGERDATRLYLTFLFTYEKFRLLMLRNRMARFELESITPFYDTYLQTKIAGVPESLKSGNRLFARVLNQLSPELAEIPYQRTMLPANVPVEYWPRGAEIENQREKLLRDVYAHTGMRLPYRRFYSNFDEWLASDPKWQRFTHSLLCSDETLITREILRPEAVAALVNGHTSQSNRAKLICLMSLELYLREYFHPDEPLEQMNV